MAVDLGGGRSGVSARETDPQAGPDSAVLIEADYLIGAVTLTM